MVKANAYGHDVLACAPLLAKAGAQWLGVTDAEEGAAVRAVCPQSRILLMSGIFPGEADTVIDQGLTPVVWEPWHLDLLEGAATARSMPPGSLPVHLEIDTGMARQGVRGSLDSLLLRFHSGSCLRHGGSDDTLLRARVVLFHPAQSPAGKSAGGVGFNSGARPAPTVAARRQLIDHPGRTRPAGPDRDGRARRGAADVAARAGALRVPRPVHPGQSFLGGRSASLPRCSPGKPR